MIFTVFGLALNAGLWYLGPQIPSCEPMAKHKPECADRGLVFHFTVCPWAGTIFPIVFQMWYTVMLAIFMLLNWPMCLMMYAPESSGRIPLLLVQWLCTLGIYAGLIWGDGALSSPALVFLLLSFFEVLFLGLAVLADAGRRPSWLPLRVLHYLMGTVVLFQFGITPIAHDISSISLKFLLFIFVGFNRFFGLGFVMTRARKKPEDDVEPLLSRAWPLVIILMTFLAPSSNWFQAGNLTYPFYPHVLDRALYVGGALIVIFTLDRVGRDLQQCLPLPAVLSWTALLLYLIHPTIISLLVLCGLMDVGITWILCLLVSFIASTAIWAVLKYGSKRRKRANGYRDADSESSEDSEAAASD